MRKQNQILKNKLSNDNKAAELKLISKEEELNNALTKNIEHEQAIKILKEQNAVKSFPRQNTTNTANTVILLCQITQKENITF